MTREKETEILLANGWKPLEIKKVFHNKDTNKGTQYVNIYTESELLECLRSYNNIAVEKFDISEVEEYFQVEKVVLNNEIFYVEWVG